jgi:hypothetical protein
MSDQRRAARLVTVSVLAAAIVAPAAGANRYGPGRTPQPVPAQREARPAATCHQYCGTGVQSRGSRAPAGHAIVRTELIPSSDGGFHWTDAAVGFAVACGGILLVFLTLLGARRMRFRPAGGAS